MFFFFFVGWGGGGIVCFFLGCFGELYFVVCIFFLGRELCRGIVWFCLFYGVGNCVV